MVGCILWAPVFSLTPSYLHRPCTVSTFPPHSRPGVSWSVPVIPVALLFFWVDHEVRWPFYRLFSSMGICFLFVCSSIVDILQYWVSFRCTAKWFIKTYICVCIFFRLFSQSILDFSFFPFITLNILCPLAFRVPAGKSADSLWEFRCI